MPVACLPRFRPTCWLLAIALSSPALAAVSVLDASGQAVTLAHPASRIVSLSPHATELLFAIGAGSKVVATVDYSNTPAAARRLPRVGSYTGISLEAVLRQRPDLVVAWQDGGSPRERERLKAMGVAVFVSHPLRLDDVAREMLLLGQLTGTTAPARQAAQAYRQQLATLSARYARRPPVSVFYQVSALPLFTISQSSFLGAVINLCGGRNVFGQLTQPAPQVSTEAVIAARPQVMLAARQADLAMWNRWRSIPAVAHGTRYAVDDSTLTIPGPRLMQAAAALCTTLDTARRQLGLTSN
ncbi:MAG TPA: cobalamin-binding protein [Chromobacteriaceae bacterium]|nr:cobalamin-binding protein [Chromobacteriaceae bacterium]